MINFTVGPVQSCDDGLLSVRFVVFCRLRDIDRRRATSINSLDSR